MNMVSWRQISKTLVDGDSVKDEGAATKKATRFLEDDEGLEVGLQKFLLP